MACSTAARIVLSPVLRSAWLVVISLPGSYDRDDLHAFVTDIAQIGYGRHIGEQILRVGGTKGASGRVHGRFKITG
jgi:hypothetical protein